MSLVSPKRPPLVHRPRKGRYAADGLTIDWFEQNHPEDTRWPSPLPEWWTAHIDGISGVSYCILNAKDQAHIAAFKKQITALTSGPYEILEFEEDLPPNQL